MYGLKQKYGLRTALTGLKRSAKVFFAQAASFNGCNKKRLRATRPEVSQTTFPKAFDLVLTVDMLKQNSRNWILSQKSGYTNRKKSAKSQFPALLV